jgi:hypothetical protein
MIYVRLHEYARTGTHAHTLLTRAQTHARTAFVKCAQVWLNMLQLISADIRYEQKNHVIHPHIQDLRSYERAHIASSLTPGGRRGDAARHGIKADQAGRRRITRAWVTGAPATPSRHPTLQLTRGPPPRSVSGCRLWRAWRQVVYANYMELPAGLRPALPDGIAIHGLGRFPAMLPDASAMQQTEPASAMLTRTLLIFGHADAHTFKPLFVWAVWP